MRIRGFPVAAASTAYGGLYGMLPYSTIMPELAERIEVLKGPSAMLNGMAPQSDASAARSTSCPSARPTSR